jgi:hypothetical protein
MRIMHDDITRLLIRDDICSSHIKGEKMRTTKKIFADQKKVIAEMEKIGVGFMTSIRFHKLKDKLARLNHEMIDVLRMRK